MSRVRPCGFWERAVENTAAYRYDVIVGREHDEKLQKKSPPVWRAS
jgi:hypothetical protein